VYDNSNPTEENVSFEGATKLPLDEGEEHCAEVFDYWGECLQEIVTILMGKGVVYTFRRYGYNSAV